MEKSKLSTISAIAAMTLVGSPFQGEGRLERRASESSARMKPPSTLSGVDQEKRKKKNKMQKASRKANRK